MTKSEECIAFTVGFLFALVLLIGGITFGSGCDPNMTPGCEPRTMHPAVGTYVTVAKVCTVCTKQNLDCSGGYWLKAVWHTECKPYCVNTTQYDCFDVDLVYEYSPGHKCSFRKESGVNTSSRNASDYVGKIVNGSGVSVEKFTGVCFEGLNNGLDPEKTRKTKVGFVLMIVGACGTVATIIVVIIACQYRGCTRLRNEIAEPSHCEPSSGKIPGIIVVQIMPQVPITDIDEQCSICLEPVLGECAAFQCMHLSHKECFDKWMLEKRTCPVCRREA